MESCITLPGLSRGRHPLTAILRETTQEQLQDRKEGRKSEIAKEGVGRKGGKGKKEGDGGKEEREEETGRERER